MKKISLLFMLMFFVYAANANPPKSVTLKFDLKSQDLDVNIIHQVNDITDHFIKTVTITVNGNEVVNEKYKKQKDSKGDVFRYTMENIKVGDVIKLTASCNKWGKKSKTLIIK